MNLKHTAMTAYFVIESLAQLLEREGVDISTIKFKAQSEDSGYESPEIQFEAMLELAQRELTKLKDADLVAFPKEPNREIYQAFIRGRESDAARNAAEAFKFGYAEMIVFWEKANDLH